ncbi:histidine decarboxylase, pyruvoyl type [Rhizobium leguminosarum]
MHKPRIPTCGHCVGNSIVACGQNHNVRYGRIFAGAKALYVPEGYHGCAIACGPYLTLAQRTVPPGWSADASCQGR